MEPMRTPIDVLSANTGGYAHYRIPGLVLSPGGTLLAYCEGRRTLKWSHWAPTDVVLRRSIDGGRAWLDRQIIAEDGDHTLNNPVAISDRFSGCVHMLYCRDYAQVIYVRSDNDGLTFSEQVEITSVVESFRRDYDWNLIATGPGHGIQLSSGRLLVPVWLGRGKPANNGHPRAMHHTDIWVSVIYSDDHGSTWRRGDIVARNTLATPSPNETAAVQLSDGRVMLNMRTPSQNRRRLISISADGISGWSEPAYHADLFDPVCMAGMTHVERAGKRSIVFSNPDSQEFPITKDGRPYFPRRNLTLRRSNDEGRTWAKVSVIDRGPAGYSDLASTPGGEVFCLYERGGDANFVEALTLATIRLGD